MSDPEAVGRFLHAILNPPEQDGPPWTHTFQPPEPVEELVEGEDGEMVLVERIPLQPTHTIEQRPTFTGVLAYLADEEQR